MHPYSLLSLVPMPAKESRESHLKPLFLKSLYVCFIRLMIFKVV